MFWISQTPLNYKSVSHPNSPPASSAIIFFTGDREIVLEIAYACILEVAEVFGGTAVVALIA